MRRVFDKPKRSPSRQDRRLVLHTLEGIPPVQRKRKDKLEGREYDRKWREVNRERLIARAREYYIAHADHLRELSRARYKQKRSEILEKCKAKYLQDAEPVKARCKRLRVKLRRDVFALLGDRCACCGEIEFHFLEVDHINGGGTQHFKAFGTWGVLREIRDDQDRAKKFRLLCSNCNKAISHIGYCPHNPPEDRCDTSSTGS